MFLRYKTRQKDGEKHRYWSIVENCSKLGASDTARENPALLDPARQTFVQIDVEPRNASWSFPAEHVLIGDAALVLRQLGAALADTARGGDQRAGVVRVAAHRNRHGYFDQPAYDAPGSPIHPQRIIGELRRNLPPEATVTRDAGENRILMTHLYQSLSSNYVAHRSALEA